MSRGRAESQRLLCGLLCTLAASIVYPPGFSYPQTVDGVLSREPVIEEMVGRVAEDSISAFLACLTGERPVLFAGQQTRIRTRFTPAVGCEIAAQCLSEIFERHGYSVRRHHYHFDDDLLTVLVRPYGLGLAAGQRGRILRTTDQNAWTSVSLSIDAPEACYRSVDLVSGDHYIIVGDGGRVATSEDGGLSWIPLDGGVTIDLHGVDVLPCGAGWAVGRSGCILGSRDGGLTWSILSSGTNAFLHDVVAFDESTAVVVGSDGVVLKTTDRGDNWSRQFNGPACTLQGAAFAGRFGWAVGEGGTILTTGDVGETWTVRNSGVTTLLYDVAVSDSLRGWAVGMNGTILRTEDGGDSWTMQTGPGHTTLVGLCAVSSREAWAVGDDGRMIHTMDSGVHWLSDDETIQAGWSNVVACKTGMTTPDEEVLLVGHYDSISDLADELAPGADDNGSGVSVIVEAARIMAGYDFGRTVKFVCFSGEEQGLLGSTAYAQRERARHAQIVGVFNLDCVGWNDERLRIYSEPNSAWFGRIAWEMGGLYSARLRLQHYDEVLPNWSDHISFARAGFDAIVAIESFTPPPPQMHTTHDTMNHLDLPFISDVTRISIAAVATVAGVDSTTPVLLTSFQGSPQGGDVVLSWSISGVEGLAGFHVYRSGMAVGGYHRLNAVLIRGCDPYSYRDTLCLPGIVYWYKLSAVGPDGRERMFGPLSVIIPPRSDALVVLSPPCPNPLTGHSVLAYSLSSSDHVLVGIYDAQGRVITTLVDDRRDAGRHIVTWDGRDGSGTPLASGLYFMRLQTGGAVRSQKIVVSR